MQNLQRRPSGVYIARLVVPERLRHAVGAREFVASTGSRSLAMAKLLASELLAGWRRQLFELDRLAMSGGPMDAASIVRIADGHPVLSAGGYLPLEQAAAVLGLSKETLLRQAADGNLALYLRLSGTTGYLTPVGSFEPDDPELGTFVVPSHSSRPDEARVLRASGVYRIPHLDSTETAAKLLGGNVQTPVFVVEPLDEPPGMMAFVPEASFQLGAGDVEVSGLELEALRRRMASTISDAVLESARRTTSKVSEPKQYAKAARPLSEAIDSYCANRLPQTLESAGEIARIRAGLSLLLEFEGDLPVGEVDADLLRHFRDHHLARLPAHENRVRMQHGTLTVTESVAAIEGSDWPRMSAGQRDQRMQWLGGMFRWLKDQKWIEDDPCTGIRGESVLTKAERNRADLEKTERQEFLKEELDRIFGQDHFRIGKGVATRAGTYRTFQPFHYWLPLLGYFTGGRINELCQPHLTDVGRDGEVWFLDINRKTPDKGLKTAWSERRVPLHPVLLELGLLEWCDALRQAGYKRLFPELSWEEEKHYSKEPVRYMSQCLYRLGMPRDNSKVFHSFRHGLNNAIQKRSQMSDIMRKRLLGHEPGESVNEQHYLADALPSDTYPHLVKLDFALPMIARFDIAEGLKAVLDALRRKNGGRGARESVGEP